MSFGRILLVTKVVPEHIHCSKRQFQTLFRLKKRKNYYAVLDVPRGATKRQIKKNYLRLAKLYHPDSTKLKNGEEKFQEVQEAYDVLGDEAKRLAYDRQIMEDLSTIFEETKVDPDPSRERDRTINYDEAFKKVFGDVKEEERLAHVIRDKKFGTTIDGVDVTERFILRLSLHEAANGCEKEVKIRGVARCIRCNGRKAAPGYRVARCPFCDENGFEILRKDPVITKTVCRCCKGTKRHNKFVCIDCEGYGYQVTLKTACFTVPPGTIDGEKLKIVIKDQVMYATVKVMEDSYFRVDNYDVHTEAEISVAQAVLGGKTKIKSLYGEEEIAISPSTSSHDYQCLIGKGLLREDGSYGDHYVYFRVKVPRELEPEMKNIFGEYAEHEAETTGTIDGIVKTAQGNKYLDFEPIDRSLIGRLKKALFG